MVAIGFIASIYGVWLVYAAGLDYLLLTSILYAPGIYIYRRVQKEHAEGTFLTKKEIYIAIGIGAAAIYALYALISGRIQI
jgi:arginine:ornithine antiporter/lysine permease